MDRKTFALVADKVGASLKEAGFEPTKVPNPTEGVDSAVFCGETAAYGVFYVESSKHFELRTCDAENGGQKGNWKIISTWLFDPSSDGAGQAFDIADDFLETIRGPKQKAAAAAAKKKRRKDDDNNVDTTFFFNRFVGVFPELKDELASERDLYGTVRSMTFARENLLPRLEALCTAGADTAQISRSCGLLNDLYSNGDLDVRAIVTIELLNRLSDAALEHLKPYFSEELARACKEASRLKGKKIKPEKVKKTTQIMAQTLNEQSGLGKK